MRFGNMFRRAVSFLGDGLQKIHKFANPIRGVAKALDTLGVGGGRLGGFVEKGLGLADVGSRSLKEFEEMTPKKQAERLGALAGEKGGMILGQGLERAGTTPGLGMGIGRGLGQLGGKFMSQGLQRLFG